MALLEVAPTESDEDHTTNMHDNENPEAPGGYFPDISTEKWVGEGSVMLAEHFGEDNNID